VAEYELRRQAYERAFNLSEQALERIEDARATGDSDQLDMAFARFRTRALEDNAAAAAAVRTGERLQSARRALLSALETEEAAIVQRIEATANEAARRTLSAQWDQVGRRIDELEAAGDVESEIALRPVPELTVRPTDTTADLYLKADFMEDRAAAYDSVIVWVGREIASLEQRILLRQNQDALVAGLSRFDSDLFPGGQLGIGQRSPSSAPDDPGDPDVAQLPYAEQLQQLQGMRSQAVQYRDRALEWAAVFREVAAGGPTP
jgi:hypothetical protein